MRRLFMLLLITLAMFRGAVGDAMAVQMIASLPAQGEVHRMPCHSTANDEEASAATPACTTCQVCHLSAFLPLVNESRLRQPPATQPAIASVHFVSADLQQASKPPIL